MVDMNSITYTAVRNPYWCNSAQTMIGCEVNFDHLDEDWVEFACEASGDYPHTHQIYAECVAGDYGPIAAYTPPPDITGSEAMKYLRRQRDAKLAETDYWGVSDTSTMTAAQIAYRTALRDLPANSPNATLRYEEFDAQALTDLHPLGYTLWVNVTWPTKP